MTFFSPRSATGLEGQNWILVACEAVDEIFFRINWHYRKILSELFQSGESCAAETALQTKEQNPSSTTAETIAGGGGGGGCPLYAC